MLEIELIDFKGDFWRLIFGAIQFNKRDGMTYALWHVAEGPKSLRGYDVIPTPVWTGAWQ